MPSLLNIYQKYKKGGGVRGKSIKVTSTIDSSSSNDITDNDIQTIKQLVNKLNLNVKLYSFEIPLTISFIFILIPVTISTSL